jgi:hypothetical protein
VRPLLWLAALLPVTLIGQSDPRLERQVKAAMLYNFAKFIEWPAAMFPSPSAPLVVAVAGGDSWRTMLRGALEGKTVYGRPISVRSYEDCPNGGTCHVVFVADSEVKRLPEILAFSARGPTLTIGDIDDFARAGGIIGLRIEDKRVRFEINLEAAQRAGLSISSKLLRLASWTRLGPVGAH